MTIPKIGRFVFISMHQVGARFSRVWCVDLFLPNTPPFGMSSDSLSRVEEASPVVDDTRDREDPPSTSAGELGGFFSLSEITR